MFGLRDLLDTVLFVIILCPELALEVGILKLLCAWLRLDLLGHLIEVLHSLKFYELSQYVQEIVLLSYVLREDLALFVTLLFLSRRGLEVLDFATARGCGLRPIINHNVQPL